MIFKFEPKNTVAICCPKINCKYVISDAFMLESNLALLHGLVFKNLESKINDVVDGNVNINQHFTDEAIACLAALSDNVPHGNLTTITFNGAIHEIKITENGEKDKIILACAMVDSSNNLISLVDYKYILAIRKCKLIMKLFQEDGKLPRIYLFEEAGFEKQLVYAGVVMPVRMGKNKEKILSNINQLSLVCGN